MSYLFPSLGCGEFLDGLNRVTTELLTEGAAIHVTSLPAPAPVLAGKANSQSGFVASWTTPWLFTRRLAASTTLVVHQTTWCLHDSGRLPVRSDDLLPPRLWTTPCSFTRRLAVFTTLDDSADLPGLPPSPTSLLSHTLTPFLLLSLPLPASLPPHPQPRFPIPSSLHPSLPSHQSPCSLPPTLCFTHPSLLFSSYPFLRALLILLFHSAPPSLPCRFLPFPTSTLSLPSINLNSSPPLSFSHRSPYSLPLYPHSSFSTLPPWPRSSPALL